MALATSLFPSMSQPFQNVKTYDIQMGFFNLGVMYRNLTLSLPRSSIDDLVFSVFSSHFLKLSYKISLLKIDL